MMRRANIPATMGSWAGSILAAMLLWLVLALPGTVMAQSAPVVILFPEVREPYRSVFLKITEGIVDGLKVPSTQYVVGEAEDIVALGQRLRSEQAKVVVALGRVGLLAVQSFPPELQVVLGAALIPRESGSASGISLTPSPEVMFGWLRELSTDVKRVTVVYNQRRDEWIIAKAREAAKQHGLVLNALPAENIREAAEQYRNFFGQLKDGSEALWLPQDAGILDENALLPTVLKEAWEKNLVVFSSNPEHVKKGVLFSLYPDNLGLGRSLAALVQERLQAPGESPRILPLGDLLIAVNSRTAEHLGLKLSSQDKRRFNLIFPSP